MLIPYFDAHCDTITEGKSLRNNGLAVDFAKEAYAKRGQIFAVYGDLHKHTMENRFFAAAEALQAACQEENNLAFCRNGADATAAAKQGKIAALLAVEGAEVLFCSPEMLEKAAKAGLSMTGITWNHANLLAGSCVESPERGLSPLGKLYVAQAVKLGLSIDISHLSPKASAEVLDCAPGQVLASHSNAFTLCPHPRNLTDDQFRAVAENGGVVGINLYTPFLAENHKPLGKSPKQGLAAVVAHIRHFASLTPFGTAPIALGCDFDGCDLLPAGLNSSDKMDTLYHGLADAGFTETEISGIFYDNLLRFLQSAGKA